MEQNLASPETIWHSMSKNFFYTLFFQGFYKDYGPKASFQEKWLLRDLLPDQGAEVKIEKSIVWNQEQKQYEISIKGGPQEIRLEESSLAEFQEQFTGKTIPDAATVQVQAHCLLSLEGKIMQAHMRAEVEVKEVFSKRMSLQITEKI